MSFIYKVFFILLSCNLICEAVEVKIKAVVDHQVITNIDINNRKKILELIGAPVAEKDILTELIEEKIVQTKLHSIGVNLGSNETQNISQYVDTALSTWHGEDKDMLKKELENKIKGVKAHQKLIETQVAPNIVVTSEEINNFKITPFLSKENASVLLLQQSQAQGASEQNLGWLAINQLVPELQKISLKTDINSYFKNPSDKEIRYKLLDIAPTPILVSNFKLLKASSKDCNDLNNNDFIKTNNIQIEELIVKGQDLLPEERKAIINLSPDEESKIVKGKHQCVKFKLLESNIDNNIREAIAYEKLRKKDLELMNDLRKESFIEIR